MANILLFTVELNSLKGRKKLGYIGKTNWFLYSEVDASDGIIDLHFCRSNSIGRARIEATLTALTQNKKVSAIVVHGMKQATISIDCVFQNQMVFNLDGVITINDKSESRSNKDDSNSTKSDLAIVKNCCASSKLSDDFLCLVNNPDSFADATLKCGSVSIPVHRGILSARSPVFSAMFKSQMQEGRDGVVDIVDMEPDVLQAMLRYVYSGKTDHLTGSLPWDLMHAANKYQLEELKLICVEELKLGIDANNVFPALVQGDLLAGSLKAHAIDFICKFTTFSELEKTEEWKTLHSERPTLAMEVVTSIVKYLQEK